MEFRNLTPFSAIQYVMDDRHNERHCVVAMKTGFRLIQDDEGRWYPRLMENPALPLCLEDEYAGEINHSPVLRESDLAPLKPACDVIINGTAYTPGGAAVPEMTAGLQVRSATGEVLTDKKLRITGRRFYQRQMLTGQWYETEPEPFTSLPLDHRHAFGGECLVEPDSEYASRIPDEYRLTGAQRREHPRADNPPLAHMACPVNPLGLGFTRAWYLQACEIQQVEAPRIIAADNPFTGLETPEGERWEYKYDPFGRRISKRCTNRDKPGTDFHWNGDQLTEEIPVRADDTPDHENAIRWIYEPGSFTPLARYEKGQLHYAVTDTAGRIQELVTEDGTIVWRGRQQLWGREESRNKEDAPSCRLRFPGQYEDAESGLYYNRFRYYDCETGQYISADPTGLNGGINPYGYVQNPLTWVDPLGLTRKTTTRKNSAGEEVTRRYVANQDELLAEAEKSAGGNLDSYNNYKPNWYESPDGNRRIEWNPLGHENTNEGPHVTVREHNGKRHGVIDKIFIWGRDFFDGKW